MKADFKKLKQLFSPSNFTVLGEVSEDRVQILPMDCSYCDKSHEPLIVSKHGLKAYSRGELIQNAFPELNDDDRERLISGYHPVCWDIMFQDYDED